VVADAVACLAAGPTPEVAIPAALATLGDGLGAARTYLFENDPDPAALPRTCSLRHEWTGLGVASMVAVAGFDHAVYEDLVPGLAARLSAGEAVFVELAQSTEDLRELHTDAPAACFLLSPVQVQGRFWGFVGFDWLTVRRSSDETRAALNVLATAVGAVLGAHRASRLLHAVFASFQASTDGMALVGPDWTVTHMNDALRAQTGLAGPLGFEALVGHCYCGAEAERVRAAVERDGGWSGALCCVDPGGAERRCVLTVRPIPGEGFLAVFADVTELQESEARLAHQLRHDALTGLPNRLAFSESLATRLADAGDAPFGVLYLDIDGFKTVNDSLGHVEGDGLLVALSRRLAGLVGPADGLFRIGGDEFAITLAGRRTAADLEHAAWLLLEACRDTYALPCGAAVYTTASLGLAVYPDDHPTPDASRYIGFADAALFRAKAQGRNRVQRYTPAMTRRATRRLTLEGELRAAVEARRLEVWLQPQFDVSAGHLTGAEALLRWPRDDGAFISPGEFVPLAEETGLIVPITEQVLQSIAAAWAPLSQAAGRPLRLAINVSPSQFHHHDVTAMLREALAESPIPEGGLEVELTESALMLDPTTMGRRLQELRDLGLRIAIDDFGTGYSSLSALRRYPLDWLKIDRSFVSDLPDDPGAVIIADTILAMARALGLRTMAEGVETEAQLEALRVRGCTGFQGFLRSPAVPVDVLLARLRADPLTAAPQK
jgi:diguanylate cyclase (GGDEF)-like protein